VALRRAPNLSDRALVLEISVIAEHHSIPVAIGWHPWFARHVGASGPLTVGIPADARLLERADDGDPTGRWVDVGAGPWVELTWAGAGRLLIRSDGGYVGLYDGQEHGVAAVPMNATPERLPTTLGPGQRSTLTVTLEWSPA
jgi:hypothetical protein